MFHVVKGVYTKEANENESLPHLTMLLKVYYAEFPPGN